MWFITFLLVFQMTAAPDLDSLRWHNRVVIIFASRKDDGQLIRQDEIIAAHLPGFAERDTKVFRMVGESVDARELRAKLHVGSQPFAVLLIGKDGSVKLRKHELLSADELFRTIDKMPMRKEEMKHK